MPRLDRFIQALQEHRAESLELSPGKPMSLVLGGASRPITKDSLTAAQIVGLVKEIAPPSLHLQLADSTVASFSYSAPAGAVQVEMVPGHEGAAAVLRLTAGSPPASTPRPSGGVPLPSEALARPIQATASKASGPRHRIEELLRVTVQTGASDLHLRTGEPAILRRDGALVRHDDSQIDAEALWAMLGSIMPPREAAELEESGDADWAFELPDGARFRCNAGQERRGPMAVFRVIPSAYLSTEELGLGPEVLKLCSLTKGLVLVAGPTGCGKSTTLAAMVDLMNRTRSDHILTIEDPIEFVHQPKQCLITQRQVGLHSASFRNALRAALREDPDVVLVGEMRDLETISIAIETAETGHLVFGTLHTNTAASTIDRIIDQFPPDRQSQVRVMLAESLRGVIAQVLCPKIGGGRIAAKEVLIAIPAVSNLIREGKTFQIASIMQTNRKAGMVTLHDALMELVEQRLVEPRDAYLKAVDKTSFATALKAKRHDTSFLTES